MVKPTLTPGLSAEKSVVTSEETSAGHLPVYSTPSMIGLMEFAAREVLEPHLDEGETSVGFRVDIRHLAATPIGKQVTARATLRELIDGRKAIFDVEAHNEDGAKIGDGMHERRIIQVARLGGG